MGCKNKKNDFEIKEWEEVKERYWILSRENFNYLAVAASHLCGVLLLVQLGTN